MSPNGRGTGQVYPIAQKTKTNYLEKGGTGQEFICFPPLTSSTQRKQTFPSYNNM